MIAKTLALAKIYADRGLPKNALALYAQVLDAQPDHPQARAAVEKLRHPVPVSPPQPQTPAPSRLALFQNARDYAALREVELWLMREN